MNNYNFLFNKERLCLYTMIGLLHTASDCKRKSTDIAPKDTCKSEEVKLKNSPSDSNNSTVATTNAKPSSPSDRKVNTSSTAANITSPTSSAETVGNATQTCRSETNSQDAAQCASPNVPSSGPQGNLWATGPFPSEDTAPLSAAEAANDQGNTTPETPVNEQEHGNTEATGEVVVEVQQTPETPVNEQEHGNTETTEEIAAGVQHTALEIAIQQAAEIAAEQNTNAPQSTRA